MNFALSRRSSSLMLQMLFVLGVAALLTGLILNARERLAAAGLTSGFGFLFRATGWEVGFSVISMTAHDPYWRAFLAGVLNTLLLGVSALTLATVLGVALGGMRNSRNAIVHMVAATYVNIFRNVPMMLQLLLWYKLLSTFPNPRNAFNVGGLVYFSNRGIYLPGLNISGEAAVLLVVIFAGAIWAGCRILFSTRSDAANTARLVRVALLWIGAFAAIAACVGFGRLSGETIWSIPAAKGLNLQGGIRISPELLACIIALTIYGAAYIAEIIRAGFNAVEGGVVEASRSLGVSEFDTFFRIRLPLAFRACLPMLINQYVWLMKATTVGIAVGFADLFMVTSSAINQSGQTFEILAIFVFSFLAINYSLAFVLNMVNRAVALKGSGLRVSEGRSPKVILLPGSWKEFRRIYLASPLQGAVSIVLGLLIAVVVAIVFNWAVLSAVWAPNQSAACRIDAAGACWSAVTTRWRLIFFGLFPYDEQWRSACALILLLALLGVSALPALWRPTRFITVWVCGGATFFVLMQGGVLGLPVVQMRDWGGLTLTVFIFTAVVAMGMPLGLILSLLRSSKMAIISRAVGGYIDVVRSIPLLALMYGAAVAMPFALPDMLQGDKLWRVIVAFALFYSAYQAEIFRSGLQGLPKGQEEAAKSLGVGYFDRVAWIIMPQVFRRTLPATVNQLVITFKETSLVTILGFFDILASGAAAFGNPEWSFAYLEVYLFVGLVYFFFVTLISRYGLYLERRMTNS